MKIAVSQLDFAIGDITGNIEKILCEYNKVCNSCDIVVFTEMCVTGYPPRDLLLQHSFIEKATKSLEKIYNVTKNTDCALVFGAPVIEGDFLYNAGIVAYKGKQIFSKFKSLLPQYDVFDDRHYFFEGKEDADTFMLKGKKIGMLICEDAWEDVEVIYFRKPTTRMIEEKPDIILNIAGSPYYRGKHKKRIELFSKIASDAKAHFIYTNQTGANDDMLFDGQSLFFNNKGELTYKFPAFTETTNIIDIENQPILKDYEHDEMDVMLKGLCSGLRKYMKRSGHKKLLIGISGGIDSSLVAAIACKAIGAENVTGIAMPSEFSTEHSKNDAIRLCQNLEMKLDFVSINEIFEVFNSKLANLFKGFSFDIAEENLQARIRGSILMTYSNKFGNLLLTTGNKSEISVGYCTLYGDMCGGLNPIGDLFKTEVYELSKYINKDKEIIPQNIINKEPSAELRKDQKDSDSLPDYNILDAILRFYVEKHYNAEEIIKEGYDGNIVKKIIRLVDTSEYKRKQSAIILKVSERSFGQGWRMPVSKYVDKT
ncbi:MAG: NAD+ synthase [Candidatus Muirbacterium halophilum]|nr:NAD+ synthase [Candidatus Muirbacterium halophilum]MCK9476474.1 NAD+ synthase [Candidatus Muirbacterium halophilum]